MLEASLSDVVVEDGDGKVFEAFGAAGVVVSTVGTALFEPEDIPGLMTTKKTIKKIIAKTRRTIPTMMPITSGLF
jgi:hypothetical protein